LCAAPADAVEPHGHAVITFEWADAPDETLGSGERVLRVAVKPVVEARSVHLSFKSPGEISISPRTGAQEAPPAPDGTRRLTLGDLQRNQTKAIELVVHAPPDKSGVAVFTVSGELAPGRGFEEKIGWTVGTPAAPTVRHGAAEYPARIEPE
jgi:hypothetical protein